MPKNSPEKKTGYICEKCGEPATHNVQKLWLVWKIGNGLGFKPVRHLIFRGDAEGDQNHFFCDKCLAEFEKDAEHIF